MPDTLTKEQRSYCMSRIRSRWTSQEKRLHNHLKGNKIKHKMHPNMGGCPDILIKNKIAVFLHGCFWHKCPKCYIEPKTRKNYWIPKIEKNVYRDKQNTIILRKKGFKVIRVWEHEIKKDFKKSILKIIKEL